MSANSKNANGSTGGGRKKGGGFLARQAHTKVLTEEELLKKDRVAPSDVLRLTRATDSESFFAFFTVILDVNKGHTKIPRRRCYWSLAGEAGGPSKQCLCNPRRD